MAEPEQELEATTSAEEIITKRTADSGLTTDAPDATVRFAEKKRLHWQGKTCEILSCCMALHMFMNRIRPRTTNDSRKPAIQKALRLSRR